MRRSQRSFIGKLIAIVFVGQIVAGCLSPRTGEYFISTSEAHKKWCYVGPYWCGSLNCLGAGLLTLPTVVGPLYFWVVRPVYDTADLVIISPVVDIIHAPVDYYLQNWRHVKLHFVDEAENPCSGIRIRLPSGNVQTSDEDGNMDFFTWTSQAQKCKRDPEILNDEYYKNSRIFFQVSKEKVGRRYVPVTKVQEIRMVRKQKISPCIDANIITFLPEYDKSFAFDLFKKDWVSPFGTGIETNLLVEMRFNYPSTEILVSVPDGKAGGFKMLRKVNGNHQDLHEWREWTDDENVSRQLRFTDEWTGRDSWAFCVRPELAEKESSASSNGVYGAIKSIGIPESLKWSTRGAGIPALQFRYRLNERGFDWFEWAEDYEKRVPIQFMTDSVDVCKSGEIHLKDACGKDVWIRIRDDGYLSCSYVNVEKFLKELKTRARTMEKPR